MGKKMNGNCAPQYSLDLVIYNLAKSLGLYTLHDNCVVLGIFCLKQVSEFRYETWTSRRRKVWKLFPLL